MILKSISIATSLGLFLWAMIEPEGYGAPALVGLALGDFFGTFCFGVNHGYLEEDDDFRLSDFAVSLVCFVGVTILFWRDTSFVAGSDEYAHAIVAGALAGGLSFLARLGTLTWKSLP